MGDISGSEDFARASLYEDPVLAAHSEPANEQGETRHEEEEVRVISYPMMASSSTPNFC